MSSVGKKSGILACAVKPKLYFFNSTWTESRVTASWTQKTEITLSFDLRVSYVHDFTHH